MLHESCSQEFLLFSPLRPIAALAPKGSSPPHPGSTAPTHKEPFPVTKPEFHSQHHPTEKNPTILPGNDPSCFLWKTSPPHPRSTLNSSGRAVCSDPEVGLTPDPPLPTSVSPPPSGPFPPANKPSLCPPLQAALIPVPSPHCIVASKRCKFRNT